MNKSQNLSAALALIGLIIGLAGSAETAAAKPILNRSVALPRSVTLTVFADSGGNNHYYYLPQAYEYCPLKNRLPDFRMKVEKNAEIPYALVQFHLCPVSDMTKVFAARDGLQAHHPGASLSPVTVDELSIGVLPQVISADVPVNFTCKAFDQGGAFKETSCLMVITGEKQVETAAQLFLHTNDLILSGYFQRVISGVEFFEKHRQYKPLVKKIPVAFHISGIVK